MKKLILSLALVTGLAGVITAQDATKTPATKEQRAKQSPEERSKHESGKAEKELGLNADQKIKWEAASLERIKSNQPLHEKLKGSTTPEERKTIHTQAKANMDKFDASVTSFLTSEQKTKWTAIKEKRKAARKDKKEHHGLDDEQD